MAPLSEIFMVLSIKYKGNPAAFLYTGNRVKIDYELFNSKKQSALAFLIFIVHLLRNCVKQSQSNSKSVVLNEHNQLSKKYNASVILFKFNL